METAVLVIGAGPVGLTMAAELARYGVAVRIVDKNAARTDKSKALVVWSRSLELIERMGCVSAFLAAGHKAIAARIVAGTQQIAHIDFDSVASPYPFGLMIPQSETERLLEEHLLGLGVAVERQTGLTGFTDDGNEVIATLRHADGREELVHCAWLLGCDGAHSLVHQAIGMEFEGDTLPSDWILADVHLTGSPPPSDEVSLYWHADGLLAFFPISEGRYRVIGDVGTAHGDGHRADPTLAEVQALVDDRGPGGIGVTDAVWLSAFRINERKVKDYRKGRVFLLGDAAHIHSPAGGQGMNTGMQDAFNLAWKLALVCRGTCPADPLLDSYSAERSAIGDQVLQDAGRLTAVAVVHNPVAQAVRNATARLVLGLSPVRHGVAEKLTEVTIGYPDSPLNGHHAHFNGPAPGDRVPPRADEAPVGAGDAPRFALFADDPATVSEVADRFPRLVDPTIRPALAEGGVWLARPDGYIAASARPEDHESLGDILARITAF